MSTDSTAVQTPASTPEAPIRPVLRPPGQSPADILLRIRDTLWISVVEGSFTNIFLSWTSSSVLTGFMLYLGGGTFELAALASVPLLAQMIQPLGAWATARTGSRKRFMCVTTSIGRGLWLFAAFLPLLPVPAAYLPMLLVLIVALSSLFQSLAGPAWVSLMADVVPEPIRGRYFGWRSGVIGVVTMIGALASGWYLDRVPKPVGFQMSFIVAVAFALVGIYLYWLHYEPRTQHSRAPLGELMLLPLRDANFRRFMLFAVYWNASVMLAAPFVIPYFFQHLEMTFTQVAIWSAIASVCGLWISPMWGKVADRVGHKTVLTITTFLAGSVHPLCWMLATPGHLFFIWVSGMIDAVSWGGIHPAMFNLGVASTRRDLRMAYLAVLGTMTGLAGCVFGMLSGPLLHVLEPFDFDFWGFHWTGYHTLFAISGLLRMQAWRLLKNVNEPRAWRARDVLRVAWEKSVGGLLR